MQNYNWRMSDLPPKGLYATRIGSSRRRMQRQLEKRNYAPMLPLLGLLLTGCAHQLPAPCPEPTTTLQPAPTQPLPSVSYLEQWKLQAEAWRRRLTFTHQTPEK